MFEGMWSGGHITSNTLTWSDGSQTTIDVIANNQFEVRLPSGIVTALLQNDGKLHWDDGDIWEKVSSMEQSSSKHDETDSSSDSDTDSTSSSSTCTIDSDLERCRNKLAMRWVIVDKERQAYYSNNVRSRSSSRSSRLSYDSQTSRASDHFEFADFDMQTPMMSPEFALAARKVHIAVRQFRGRKLSTAIWGFPDRVLGHRLDFPKILRAMKRIFRTNGSLRTESGSGVVIQLHGDCWKAARHFLVHQDLVEDDSIQCHGVLGLGLGGLKDLTQLDAMLTEETGPRPLDLATPNSRQIAQNPSLATTFHPQRLCLTGFQGLSQAAVAQELVSLEAQLRFKAQRTRGSVANTIACQTEAALQHLEVVDADFDSGEVSLLVNEQSAYNTILGLFAKGSLKIRGRTVSVRRDGDIYNGMDWHQIRSILCHIEKTRGHRCAENRQLARRLEELLLVVDANSRGLFGPQEAQTVLSLLIRFELDHFVTAFGRAKWESWKRLLALVQRHLRVLLQLSDAMTDDPSVLSADIDDSLVGRQEQISDFLCYSILQLDDEFHKMLQTGDRDNMPCNLADFHDVLRLLESSMRFFQKHVDLCSEALWRIAARILDRIYNMDCAYFESSGIGQEIGMPTLQSWIQCLGVIVRKHGDSKAQTTAALQQVHNAALCNQFQEASTLLVLSQAADQAQLMDQRIQILCNQTVSQLGLSAFRLGKLTEARECLQNICAKGRARELLGYRQNEEGKQQSYARDCHLRCHASISVELVEVVYLIVEMLWQLPTLSGIEIGSKFTPKSFFQRRLCQFEAATYSGPPQDRYECVLVASRRLQQGDWEYCMVLLERALFGFWHGIEASGVIDILRQNVKKSALKTYLIDSSAMYESFELSRLANMFCLDERFVHSTVSRMMIEKEFPATWDESSRLILVQESSQDQMWEVACQLAHVASSIVESNERRIHDVERMKALKIFKPLSLKQQAGPKVATRLQSNLPVSGDPAKAKEPEQTSHNQDSVGDEAVKEAGGRQSRFRKDLINLNKAVVRWMKKVAANQMAHDEVLLCIGRSPAVQHLQKVHGESFSLQDFVSELLGRAAKAIGS